MAASLAAWCRSSAGEMALAGILCPRCLTAVSRLSPYSFPACRTTRPCATACVTLGPSAGGARARTASSSNPRPEWYATISLA
eukprot:11208548-Lingulodinium_polyedra.AAC.1